MGAALTADVLVVGGGIAGGAFACALRGRGYRVVVVESRSGTLDTARGDHLQCATVEQLGGWGIHDVLLARGAEKRLGADFFTHDGEQILENRYEELPIPYPYYLIYHHDLLGELLLELAAADPNTTVLRPVTARKFELAAGEIRGVELTLADGSALTVHASVVVGADGAGSPVRAALGIGSATHAYEHPLVILFAPAPDANPRKHVKAYMGPPGMAFVIPRLGDQVKVGLPVRKEEIGFWKGASAEELRARVAARAPALDITGAELAGFYPVRMRHADRWAVGTTVLLGDACHAIHPILGQGLNLGVRDAAVLADSLPPPDLIADLPRARAALAAYETARKPPTDTLLARNHAFAQLVDTFTPEATAQFVEAIRGVAADPAAAARFVRDTTGYSFGFPSDAREE